MLPNAESIVAKYPHLRFESKIQSAFPFFALTQIILKSTGFYLEKIKLLKGSTLQAYLFFKHISSSIEIFSQGKTLQKVYFIRHPSTFYLKRKHKDDTMESINIL
jgi:hypothetical protein